MEKICYFQIIKILENILEGIPSLDTKKNLREKISKSNLKKNNIKSPKLKKTK